MISFIYQVQSKSRKGWLPVFHPKSSKPLEFTDIHEAIDMARLLASKFSNIRVVKIEVYLIETLS